MNEIQNGLLNLILEIDDICTRNGITFYLGGGTALGAVRHNGFLPWDDDSDLYITRDNWKKLLAVIDDELAPNRDLVCIERTPLYLNPIARYMDLDTTWIYQSQMFAGTPLGQHAEFLILDPMPNGEEEQKRYLQLFAVYSELLTPWFVVNRNTAGPNNVFDYKLYKKYYKRTQSEGMEPVLAELEAELYGYPDEDGCEYYHLRHGVEIHSYSREFFGEPKRVPFEGHELPVAGRAERVLRQAYGPSWKRVPPAEEQALHISTHDLDAPYTEFLEDYFTNVDIERARECNISWKYHNVDCLLPKERREYLLKKTSVSCDRLQVEQRFESIEGEPAKDEIDLLHKTEKAARAYGLDPCNIDDRQRELCIKACFGSGEYWKANILLAGLKSAETRNAYEQAVSVSQDIDCLIDEEKYDEAASMAQSVPDEIKQITPYVYHAQILAAGEGDDRRALAEKAHAEFPNYTFFSFALAEANESNDPAGSLETYQRIVNECNDGIIVLKTKRAIERLAGGSEGDEQKTSPCD